MALVLDYESPAEQLRLLGSKSLRLTGMCCLEVDSVVILKSSLALASPNVCPPYESEMGKEEKSIIVFLKGLSSGVCEPWHYFTQVIF